MATFDVARLGVLALLADPTPMHTLLDALRLTGLRVDAAADLQTARNAFFRAGGHDCLVIAPDVRPALARSVAATLRAVDPELAMATFGPSTTERPRPRFARLSGYHPGSRAGQGALLRFLHNL